MLQYNEFNDIIRINLKLEFEEDMMKLCNRARQALSVFLIAAVFLVAGCSGKSHPGAKLRIGYLPIAAELPLFVAIEKGYFTDAGFEYELVRFASSNDMGNAATADRIDILAGAASNVIFDIGHVSGKKHQVFCINPYSNTPGHVTDHLLVRKGSGIDSLSQLLGKKVASFPGSVNRIFCYLILEKYGIPRTSYEYLELQPKDWELALQARQVDAVSALEPQATQIIFDSVGISIFPGFYADLMPNVPLSAHWVSADFMARTNKKDLDKIVKIYDKAIDFCRNHLPEAKTYLAKYANVREDILGKVNVNPWQKRAEIEQKHFQAYVDLLFDNGALQSKAEVKEYILPH
jgi:NitT/TauT family transport system substrate-binding protein